MTPQQQAALEGLVSRPLTSEELGQIEPWLNPEDRRDDLITALLSQGRTRVQSRMVSARGLAERYNGGDPLGAEIVLLKLEGFVAMAQALEDSPQNQTTKMLGRVLKRQLGFLNADGLDFGSLALRNMLDQFATAGIITASERDHLKAVAVVPDPLVRENVSRALNIAEGRMVL